MLSFSLLLHSFVSVVEDRIENLFARCGFGVSLVKGEKYNEETKESTGSPIFHGDLASGVSAEMFSFF